MCALHLPASVKENVSTLTRKRYEYRRTLFINICTLTMSRTSLHRRQAVLFARTQAMRAIFITQSWKFQCSTSETLNDSNRNNCELTSGEVRYVARLISIFPSRGYPSRCRAQPSPYATVSSPSSNGQTINEVGFKHPTVNMLTYILQPSSFPCNEESLNWTS